MITKAKTNKKYLFRQMQPGDTFRLNIEDVLQRAEDGLVLQGPVQAADQCRDRQGR